MSKFVVEWILNGRDFFFVFSHSIDKSKRHFSLRYCYFSVRCGWYACSKGLQRTTIVYNIVIHIHKLTWKGPLTKFSTFDISYQRNKIITTKREKNRSFHLELQTHLLEINHLLYFILFLFSLRLSSSYSLNRNVEIN